MHRVVRPAFWAFVILVPAVLLTASVLCAVCGRWWATVYLAVLAATPISLVPRERALRRQGRGQGRVYGELRTAVAASVPLGQSRVLRRYGDPLFYAVARRRGRLWTERVIIQRFDEADLPDFGELLAGPTGRGALVCTVFQLHPWYPAVSREVHGTTVTADGQHLRIQPAEPTATGPDSGARRLGIRTGLGQADAAELREVVDALAHADIVTGGPGGAPSL